LKQVLCREVKGQGEEGGGEGKGREKELDGE